MPIHDLARQLNDEEMRKFIEAFLHRLKLKDPKLVPDLENRKEELVELMLEHLKQNKSELKLRDLNDKVLIKELMITLVAVLSLNKQSLDPNKQFLEKLEKLLKERNLLGLTRPEFEKKLTNKDKRDIHELVKNMYQEIAKDLEKVGLFQPRPGFNHAEHAASKFDNMTQLFGLASSAIAGTIAVPITYMAGNGLGITDFNPHHGFAQIDLANKIDSAQGDPQGNEARAKQNYMANAGNVVEEFQQDLLETGIKFTNTPTLSVK